MNVGGYIEKALAALRSPRGRDALMFLLFVFISTILWAVLSLNEDVQRDIRMPLKITHIPDSVTLINRGPEALSVSLRGKGTQIIKMSAGGAPDLNVDFRAYRSNGAIRLSNADLKALVRNATGGSQVIVVYPDSLILPYNTHSGYRLPVRLDYKVTAAPQSALVGMPHVQPDSVDLFLATNVKLPDNISISTEPVRMTALQSSTTRRVKLIVPPGTRAIPDSVDVVFNVEPMIFKSRKVVIEPVNVPGNIKLITFPAQIDAFFMVPTSAYSRSATNFRVVADFRSIKPGAKMVRLNLVDVAPQLKNVQLSADSAEYIIERH